MKCLNCDTDVGSIHTGSPFCSGACKHEYRSGQDPDLCAQCQERPASKRGSHVGYCSRSCERRRQLQRVWG